MLLALSLLLFGIGAPLKAAPNTSVTMAVSHCEQTDSSALSVTSISDCLSHCALPAPSTISMTMNAIRSERYAAPSLAWQVVSIAPPSPPPRSDS
ncbi:MULTISPECIES: hypothetical protein [Deefgea]|uniref:DUF2946 domain-containing protein n=1 Tax=Deefgea chitinilytica TaxID=570276 RepID=A0ABS2CFB8_9NEIS|nr:MULTISPECIES: hypothetical protein [Deefgea]MBM5572844.1 hypothetical protein [Deefgea chitinilytica]MBM9890081.1 hypothetical protein [Deefgea sp. CFH1-16]